MNLKNVFTGLRGTFKATSSPPAAKGRSESTSHVIGNPARSLASDLRQRANQSLTLSPSQAKALGAAEVAAAREARRKRWDAAWPIVVLFGRLVPWVLVMLLGLGIVGWVALKAMSTAEQVGNRHADRINALVDEP